MLHTTPQERLALGVVALLLSAGAGVRWLAAGTEDPAWVDSGSAAADTLLVAPIPPPTAEVEREMEREQVRSTPLAPGERIDPNRATADELQRLPRVGPALAARIVAHRDARGGLRSLADLDEVPGIGPAMLRSLAPLLTLPAAPAARGEPGERDARLDLNRATAAELEALPGLGEALAGRIVAWRTAHGPFRSLEALEEVPGIGPALRARLAPRLHVRD